MTPLRGMTSASPSMTNDPVICHGAAQPRSHFVMIAT
jgi:hypothetical protein